MKALRENTWHVLLGVPCQVTRPLRNKSLPAAMNSGMYRSAAFNSRVYGTIAPAGHTALVRDQPGTVFRVSGPGEEPVPGRIGR
jgi:hypothetical protein